MSELKRFDATKAKKDGATDEQIVNAILARESIVDVQGRGFNVKKAKEAGISDEEIVQVLITGRGFDRSGNPVAAFGRGVASSAAKIAGIPMDAARVAAEGIVNRPPETSIYSGPPVQVPPLPGGSASIRSGMESVIPNSTYESLQDLPRSERPIAAAGEVFGGGLPIVGGTLTAARMGAQGPGMVRQVMDMARRSPKRFAAVEAASLGGSAQGAALAELYFPGDSTVRLGAEVAGGFMNPLGLVLRAGGGAVQSTKDFVAGFSQEGVKSKYATTLQKAMQDVGEDPVAVARALRKVDLPGVELTSGQKTGSPTLLALERRISKENAVFGEKAKQRADESLEALREIADRLTATGDPNALKAAARARQEYHNALISARVSQAQQEAALTWAKIGKKDPQLASRNAYESLHNALMDARKVEGDLHNAIPKNIPMRAEDGFNAYQNMLARLAREEPVPGDLKWVGEFVDRAKDGIESGELLRVYSRLRAGARKARGTGDFDLASMFDEVATGVQRDIGNIPGEAASRAREYSVSLNDAFTRSFAGDVLDVDKAGALRVNPELMLDAAFGQGRSQADVRFRELAQAAGFTGNQPELAFSAQIRGQSMVSEQENFLRYAAGRLIDADGSVKPDRLATFLRENESVLNRFPELRGQLADAQSAQQAFQDAARLANVPRETIAKRNAFGRIFGFASPAEAVGGVLQSANPERHYFQLVRASKAKGIEDGLKAATLEHAMQQAQKGGGFSFKAYNDTLTSPMSGAKGPSVLEVMERSGIMNRRDSVLTRRLMKRASDIEEALVTGRNLDQIIGNPDAVTDLVIRIVGSRLGAQGAAGAAAGASLVAAGAGSRFMQRLFNKIPNTRVMAIAEEAALNPKLAAALLERPTTVRQARNLEKQINAFLIQAGITYATSEEQNGN